METREIINDPRRLALLADEFREGREKKISELLALLNSDDQEIVAAGAWIAGEVKLDPVAAQPVISRLQQLVNHKEPAIRFCAIGALFPFLDGSDPGVREMLVRLRADSNKGVRMAAQAALTRMSQR